MIPPLVINLLTEVLSGVVSEMEDSSMTTGQW
jgi:hypothetical protein